MTEAFKFWLAKELVGFVMFVVVFLVCMVVAFILTYKEK